MNYGGITKKVEKIIKHPNYSPQRRTNDIGLIKLDSPVEFDQFIQPIALPTNDIDVGSRASLTGFGYTNVS